jgi:sulfite dehydrogenase (quinone) subunit SoeC
MHPAWSVILFTVLAGLGQGLFVMLVRASDTGVAPHLLGLAGLASTTLLCIGLACSFFHLGHPLRAWRAVAMWRTSWLSREVIVLPVTIAVVATWSVGQLAGWPQVRWLGVLGVALCFVLWVCTGMIYACIRFLREWAHPLTIVNFVLLGWMSGATAFAALCGLAPGYGSGSWWLTAAIVLTVAGACARLASLARNRQLKPLSTAQSALGVPAAKLRQMSQGATGGSFNTREFFHGKSALVVKNVRWMALGLCFALPLLLLVAARYQPEAGLVAGAALCQLLGLLAERWLFFAQANHPQNIYYRAVA